MSAVESMRPTPGLSGDWLPSPTAGGTSSLTRESANRLAKEVFGDKLPGSLTVELADSLINVAKAAPEDLDLHDKLVVAKVVDQYARQTNCIECPRLAEEFSFVDSLEYLGAKNWDLNVDHNDFRALYEGSLPQNGLPHPPHTGPFFESSAAPSRHPQIQPRYAKFSANAKIRLLRCAFPILARHSK